MTCPNCGGDAWNNAAKIQEGAWKGPLYKCKDANCGWIQWPPKPKAAPVQRTGAGPGAPSHGPKWTWPLLSETYLQSLLIARMQVVGLATAQKLELRMEDILSAAATVFIAASRDGVKPIAREPAPEPEPNYDDPE